MATGPNVAGHNRDAKYAESSDGPVPQVDRGAEAVFRSGGSGQVRPSVPIQGSGQSGVVHGGEIADRSDAASVDGGDEVDEGDTGAQKLLPRAPI